LALAVVKRFVAERFEGQCRECVGARIVENMERSLAVPTATSVREVPAKLLEVNRRIINNYLKRIDGGKVSFTHLIAYAMVRALDEVPAMARRYTEVDGKPAVLEGGPVGLGLAVDVPAADGGRSLLVPVIQTATRSTSPASSPPTRRSCAASVRTTSTRRCSPVRRSRSPTRARSGRCTRCRV
jgi:pyruvate/2-oxoglutarate dehydrogenase complex dihydrolipoamide acyltransferase (E2) component